VVMVVVVMVMVMVVVSAQLRKRRLWRAIDDLTVIIELSSASVGHSPMDRMIAPSSRTSTVLLPSVSNT